MNGQDVYRPLAACLSFDESDCNVKRLTYDTKSGRVMGRQDYDDNSMSDIGRFRCSRSVAGVIRIS